MVTARVKRLWGKPPALSTRGPFGPCLDWPSLWLVRFEVLDDTVGEASCQLVLVARGGQRGVLGRVAHEAHLDQDRRNPDALRPDGTHQLELGRVSLTGEGVPGIV